MTTIHCRRGLGTRLSAKLQDAFSVRSYDYRSSDRGPGALAGNFRPTAGTLAFGAYCESNPLGLLGARHPGLFDIIGGGRFDIAALNPQALPPGAAVLRAFAEEVIDRTLLMQEVADAMSQTGEEHGIIIVSGRQALLVEELCGNNFKAKIPFPKPRRDEGELLSGLELLTVSAVFEQNAATAPTRA